MEKVMNFLKNHIGFFELIAMISGITTGALLAILMLNDLTYYVKNIFTYLLLLSAGICSDMCMSVVLLKYIPKAKIWIKREISYFKYIYNDTIKAK